MTILTKFGLWIITCCIVFAVFEFLVYVGGKLWHRAKYSELSKHLNLKKESKNGKKR